MPDDAPPPDSTTNISGGINVDATGNVTVGGDAVGRDKVVSAGGHIITAGPGATVNIGVSPAPEPEDLSPTPGKSPFKGLEYFDEADADRFFGREQLTAKLVTQVYAQRFLAIVGASGSGKSSVVRAGLIPAIRRDHPRWPIHVITPTAHPLKELAATLTREVESVTATVTLIDDLLASAHSLDLAVDKLLKKYNRGEQLVLIVDQFEELFTACKDDHERRVFVDNLLYAVAPDTSGPVLVIITLRADFYAHCGQFDNLREALAKRQEYIGAMTADELRQAIEAPAKQGGWEFEPELVDLLLRDAGSEPGALPLLSHALLETWQRRRRRTLTLAGYYESGGVRGAIARTAETVFNQLTPDRQVIARRIFLRLTEPGEGTQDTRRRAALSELIARSEDASVVEAVLKTLTDARLVTTSENMAEVAHEALIREWPKLRGWLDEDREGLRLHRQLTDDAQEWIDLQRDDGVLYRGMRLERASDWVENHADELNLLEHEFFEASHDLRERERVIIEAAHQKELDDAKKMAETAGARALAERRIMLLTRSVLGAVTGAFILAVMVILFSAPSGLVFQNNLTQSARTGVSLVSITDQFSALEAHAVTNRQYEFCVEAGACSEPAPRISSYFVISQTELPVAGIDAIQAARYCQWLGRRLPSRAEWEIFAGQAVALALHVPEQNRGEWTSTTLSDTLWSGKGEDAPKELWVIWGNGSRQAVEYHLLPPDFRREDISFRCVEAKGP